MVGGWCRRGKMKTDAPSSGAPPRRCCRLVYGSVTFRYVELGLVACLVVALYFNYDLPSITATQLKQAMHRDNTALGASRRHLASARLPTCTTPPPFPLRGPQAPSSPCTRCPTP
jgi:hypothetical protein